MKVLCWNTNDSVWSHWKKVVAPDFGLNRTQSFEETVAHLTDETFDYCFVYIAEDEFLARVEQVITLRQRFTDLKLLAFPYRRDQAAALRMLSNGVNGQCSPFIGREQLGLVLNVIDSGEIWGGKEFIQQLIQQNARTNVPDEQQIDQCLEALSEREKKVTLLVTEGLSNKQIAQQMDITERTVKAHLTAIYKKLDVRDRLSLALYVKRHASDESLVAYAASH